MSKKILQSSVSPVRAIDVEEELFLQQKRGVLLVLIGPTAVGKDTVIELLLKSNDKFSRLVTTNSRPVRVGEIDGHDYHFVSNEEFEKLIESNSLLEWVKYRGYYRGGQKRHVEAALTSGKDVIWRIDVKGAKAVKKKILEFFPHTVFVYLSVNNLDTLKSRMLKRGSESESEIKWSLKQAAWEQKQWRRFDYVVANEENKLQETVDIISKIVEVTRHKVA